jgi:peptidoglycan/LPS O-acetylase OafA/YrhL
MPGLDGLRAIAVLAVIAYHLGAPWAQGGLLGVGVFFTLSGYLITDLLLGRWRAGSLRLGNFWIRRARRLLPALFLMLIVVTAWVTLAQPSQLASLRGAVASAATYWNNWWLISQHISYFARFGPPSPLGHLWSLAIEEQFYLLWPFVLILGLRFVRERPGPARVHLRLALITIGLAIASAVLMAVLYHPGFDSSRVYDGTDTRAFGLLFGAALAMVWPAAQLSRNVAPPARRLLDGLGTIGLVGIALLIWRTNQYSSFLFPIGFVLLSLSTVLLLAALVHPAARLGRILGIRPLRWIGVRSYGIYLWHFPVIVLTTPTLEAGHVALGRAVLQTAATFIIAALSWRFVEDPIRRGALGRIWTRVKSGRWSLGSLPRLGWATLGASAAVLVLASFGMAGVAPVGRVSSLAASTPVDALSTQAPLTAPGNGKKTALAPISRRPPSATPSGASAESSDGASNSTKTSCRAVVHIGDSTSEGLISPDYLPKAKERIGAQYARVGARSFRPEITGATSIVETLPGGENAYDVARGLVSQGYKGCWVIALGTNDTADVYVGSSVGVDSRIERMMSVLGKQPVLWVNVKSLVSSGPYNESNMQDWDNALLQECSKYPSMHVYDWASVVKDGWFIPDGIHFTTPGYAARGRLIANALAEAFPASGGSPSGCVVH